MVCRRVVGLCLALAAPAGAEDLAGWCQQHRAGYIATSPPEADAAVLARLAAEPQARLPFETPGAEVGWYKNVVVLAPPPVDPDWSVRLTAGMSAEDRALLVREVYGRPERTAEATQYVLDAITIVGRRDEARHRRLREACLWLLAPSFGEVRWSGESLRRGIGFLRYHPEMPATGGGKVPFSVQLPLPSNATGGERLYYDIQAPGDDVFAVTLAEAKLPIALDEYKRRQVVETDKLDAPFAEDPRLDGPVLLGETATTVAAAAQRLANQSGVPLTAEGPVAPRVLRISLETMPLRHALVGLARAAGAVLCRDGAGYRLAAPASPRDWLTVDAPLPAWTWWQHNRAEAWLAEAELRERFHRCIPPGLPEHVAQTPTRLNQLPPALRQAATDHAGQRLGRHLRLLAESLPGPDDRIPLWTHYVPERLQYELIAPAYSEYLHGLLALRADLAISGGAVAPLPPRRTTAAGAAQGRGAKP